MKVLLVGGTGVLSTDIAAESIKQGYDTILLNRGSHPERVAEGVTLIRADIRDPHLARHKLEGNSYDVVVDFLSYTPQQLQSTMEIVKGFCGQYIFISSATAYNKSSEDMVITEECPIGNPNWSYALNKSFCEEWLEENYNSYVKSYTIVRPYVTYGDTRIPFAVIPGEKQWTLANRILNGKPVVLWDEGKAVCTLTHTVDFARAMVGLFGNSSAEGQAFHIASDESQTWLEVTNTIADTLGCKALTASIPSEVIAAKMSGIGDSLKGDKATNWRFDNSKIKSVVPGWECEFTFQKGIAKTIAYYKANLDMQKIDYAWDGQCDRMIAEYYKNSILPLPFGAELLTVKAYKHGIAFGKKLAYYSGRYRMMQILSEAVLTVRGLFIGAWIRLRRLFSYLKKGDEK